MFPSPTSNAAICKVGYRPGYHKDSVDWIEIARNPTTRGSFGSTVETHGLLALPSTFCSLVAAFWRIVL